jgi:hypothetical protein
MDRRTTLKWMTAAAAGMPLLGLRAGADAAAGGAAAVAGAGAGAGAGESAGYGTDPDLKRAYRPGDVWPLTLSEAERRTAAALCDLILPADESSPSASSVGVVDFLDEWVSAPYPRQQADRPLVLAGLAWLDEESQRRFDQPFATLDDTQQRAIGDDICDEARARAEFAEAAKFFACYRDLTAGGYYSSPEGRRDIGYVGNVPQVNFVGPPAVLLAKLGLA